MFNQIVSGFSKLTKAEKLEWVAKNFSHKMVEELKSFWYQTKQEVFDEFSENTLSNFVLPFGIAPNFMVNGKIYHVPMVIEESSVIAAASNAAKFWSRLGGFHARVTSFLKEGQVHFSWSGEPEKLEKIFPELQWVLMQNAKHITEGMEKRGGGVREIKLENKTLEMPGYYQLKVQFDTRDAMGANFINTCLEDFSKTLKAFISSHEGFTGEEKKVEIIMAILSNYTPDCIVETFVETTFDNLKPLDPVLSGEEFARKFEKAVKIAGLDTYRAVTHNKGIFNGIDAVILATGNDFRAIEAGGHAYAARDGMYRSLSFVEIGENIFRFGLKVPLALGTVGGLTSVHPLARRSLELLGNPGAQELMMITASAGLANNFSAVRALITSGIQKGHMKMHLNNILNQLGATEYEKHRAYDFFRKVPVSFKGVKDFLHDIRKTETIR